MLRGFRGWVSGVWGDVMGGFNIPIQCIVETTKDNKYGVGAI